MPYTFKTQTIIQSATLTLSGQQLQDLAAAREALAPAFADWPSEAFPARELLNTVAGILAGTATPAPAPKATTNRLSPEGLAQMQAKAAARKRAKKLAADIIDKKTNGNHRARLDAALDDTDDDDEDEDL
jgi:hypothetical protein